MMKKAIVCMLVFILALTTVVPVSAAVNHKPLGSHANAIDVQEEYKSLIEIPSPDGTSYRCIMFCENHKQTAEWKTLVDDFFVLPGTILFFGLGDFRNWYMDLLIKEKHSNEFVDFLSTYDFVNGSGMITYLWLTGTTKRPVDFKAQPDNSWIGNSWVPDGTGMLAPNPEIWNKLYFWYFDLPMEV
jgi:hypothetical protein